MDKEKEFEENLLIEIEALELEELIIEGYTIPEIAEQWGFQSTTVAGAFTPSKKGLKYIDFEQPKEEVVELPKGDSITFDRLYTWESLSELEKLFYEQYEEKHKAYYGV